MNSALFIVAVGVSFKLLDESNALNVHPLARDKRAVYDKTSSNEEFPYLVALERYSDHWCTGTILSSHHIITAAHCFDGRENPSAYQVRISEERDDTVFEVESYVVHEEYEIYGSRHHDVALLRLKNPIYLGSKVKRPLIMFESGEETEPSTRAVVAGWRRPSYYGLESPQISSNKLAIVDKKECDESWLNWGNHEGIFEGQICASDVSESRSDCKGDSGSPLVINGKLAGILSVTYRCGSYMSVPSLFTEVSYFRQWIENKMTETNWDDRETGNDEGTNGRLISE